jgi:hypothetical protein
VAGCADPAPLLSELETYATEGRIEQAEKAEDALVAALGCSAIADRATIARLWLAQGMVLAARGEDEASTSAFAAAARLSPDTWNPDYGPVHEQRFRDAAQTRVEAGRVALSEPVPLGWYSAIDGTVLQLPAALPAGPHLLQIGQDPLAMNFATTFELPAGLELEIVAPDFPEPPPPPTPPDTRRARRTWQAVVVGGLGVVAYGMSFAANSAYYGSGTLHTDRSVPLRYATDGLVIAAGGLAATSAGLFVRAFTTRPRDEAPAPRTDVDDE